MTSAEYRDKFKTKDKVAIVGFADSKDQAPYNDDSFEIWGLNSLFEIIPRWDVWFEIHDRKIFGMDTNKEIGYGLTRTGQPYMEALGQLKYKDKPTPVFMVDRYDDLPNSYRYPVEEMIGKFDPSGSRIETRSADLIDYRREWNGYWTNSISYMIALAIDWGYQEIHIYGVDMATAQGGEYAYQRPSCEYYLGIAQGKGIKLYIPNEADLLKTRYRYGFDDENNDRFVAKVRKLNDSMNERMKVSQQNFDFHRRTLDACQGQVDQLREISAKLGAVYADSLHDDIKAYIKETDGKLSVVWKDNMAGIDLDRKQIDQYIGAIESAKEIMKIWG